MIDVNKKWNAKGARWIAEPLYWLVAKRPKFVHLCGLSAGGRGANGCSAESDIHLEILNALWCRLFRISCVFTVYRDTKETEGIHIPDIDFLKRLKADIKNSAIIAEGGIHTYEELAEVLDTGIEHIVIGGAITRPQNITKDYVNIFAKNPIFNHIWKADENTGQAA